MEITTTKKGINKEEFSWLHCIIHKYKLCIIYLHYLREIKLSWLYNHQKKLSKKVINSAVK